MNIQIISSTDRPNSNSLRFSKYLKQAYTNIDVDAGIISLEQFPLADVAGGVYGNEPDSILNFRAPVLDADGLIFVIPEYNGSFPGILKMLIDYLPYPHGLEMKPVCFVGIATGAFGALRAVEQLQMILGYRNVLAFPERVFIQRFKDEFDEQIGIKDPVKRALLENQIAHFTEFVKKNKS